MQHFFLFYCFQNDRVLSSFVLPEYTGRRFAGAFAGELARRTWPSLPFITNSAEASLFTPHKGSQTRHRALLRVGRSLYSAVTEEEGLTSALEDFCNIFYRGRVDRVARASDSGVAII